MTSRCTPLNTRAAVYACLCDYQQQQGYAPSLREIARSTGLRSVSTVSHHLKALEQEGAIRLAPGQKRAITLCQRSAAPEGCIPLLGDASGSPLSETRAVEDYLSYPVPAGEPPHFALRMCGDSMRPAGILPGDVLVVRQQEQARHGEVVLALLGGCATVRTLHRNRGGLWLCPADPALAPLPGRQARILGRVVGVLRRYA